MKFRWLITVLLLVAVPSALYARWIKDEVVLYSDGGGKVVFSHYNHLEAVGKDCPTCHNDVFNIDATKNPEFTMAEMEKGKSCGSCHNGNRAFSVKEDCSTCHPTRDIEIQVAATGVVTFSHDVHTGMFGCGECHPGLFIPDESKNKTVTMAAMEDGESCGACHDGDAAFGVKQDCSSCHPTRDIKIQVAATGVVTFSHDVHTGMFGCGECHPDLFVPDESQNKPATMAAMEKGESCGACHDGDAAFGVKQDCSSCHPTREIVFKVEDVGDVTFSHDVHTGMFGCGECHPDLFVPDQKKHKPVGMDAMAEGESCGACHDGGSAFSVTDDAGCDSCHAM